MKHGELLDTLREDILKDRSDPPLWSDRRLCQCLHEAYMDFAEQTLLIRDNSSPVTRITLEAGTDEYEYDESVLAILSVRPEGSTVNLKRFGDGEMHQESSPGDTMAWLEAINAGTIPAGPPRAFSTDAALRVLTIAPTPSTTEDGQDLILRCARLPRVEITEDSLDEEVEIPRQYAMGIVHGAAAIAYTDQDADGNDPQKAVTQQAKFAEYVGRGKKGAGRQMFQPLTWGFGQSGFAHSK